MIDAFRLAAGLHFPRAVHKLQTLARAAGLPVLSGFQGRLSSHRGGRRAVATEMIVKQQQMLYAVRTWPNI